MLIFAKPYLSLLRIKDWRGYFLLSTFGFLLARGYRFSPERIILFYLIVFFYLGFTFAVNDYFDVKEDKFNFTKKNPIVEGHLKSQKAAVFYISLGFLGLSLSVYFGLTVLLFYLLLMLTSLFYSSPPLRFKSRFILDLLSHGLFFGVFLFFLPLLIFKIPMTYFHYLIGVSIFHLSVILELRNHLEDYECDKKASLATTACVLGLKKSQRLTRSLALLFPVLPLILFFSQTFFLPLMILTTLFYFAFIPRKNYRLLDVYANLFYLTVLLEVFL